MYKEVLRNAEGLGVFPTISIVIFFLFFIGLLIYVFTRKQKDIDRMSELPLEEDQ